MRVARKTTTSIAMLLAVGGQTWAQGDCGTPGGVFVPSPDATAGTNILWGVDGLTSDDVWAVGFSSTHQIDATPKTLALHWDGSVWSLVQTPNIGDGWNDLADAAATSGEVWAVGSTGSGEPQPLILRWDGASWEFFEADVSRRVGTLEGAEAIASDDVWAVGRGERESLAAHWDGSDWETEPVPPVGALRNPLLDVDAVARDDVWAVGYWSDSFGQFNPLAAHWDGSNWTSMEVPTIGIAISRLRGVAAITSDNVWAVGDRYDLEEKSQPLIVHWDGASWTPIELPVIPGGPSGLEGIAALAPDDIYAVGTHEPFDDMTALVMHYDGETWSVLPDLPTDGSSEWFRSMETIDGVAWGVGQYFNGEQTSTLTARFTSGCCADLDGDGDADGDDFFAYLDLFAAGHPDADLDGDGDTDADDFFAYLDLFAVGC